MSLIYKKIIEELINTLEESGGCVVITSFHEIYFYIPHTNIKINYSDNIEKKAWIWINRDNNKEELEKIKELLRSNNLFFSFEIKENELIINNIKLKGKKDYELKKYFGYIWRAFKEAWD